MTCASGTVNPRRVGGRKTGQGPARAGSEVREMRLANGWFSVEMGAVRAAERKTYHASGTEKNPFGRCGRVRQKGETEWIFRTISARVLCW